MAQKLLLWLHHQMSLLKLLESRNYWLVYHRLLLRLTWVHHWRLTKNWWWHHWLLKHQRLLRHLNWRVVWPLDYWVGCRGCADDFFEAVELFIDHVDMGCLSDSGAEVKCRVQHTTNLGLHGDDSKVNGRSIESRDFGVR